MPLTLAAEFLMLAALWGASFLFARLAVADFGPLPTAAMRCAIGAAMLLPVVVVRGQVAELRRHGWVAGWIGVLNAGIPFVLFTFAVQYIDTGVTSLLNATVPLFGAMVAWVWLKDRPNGSRVLGLALGFSGMALLALRTGMGSASGWALAAGLLGCFCYALAGSATRVHLTGVPAMVTAAASLVGATLVLAIPAWWLAPAHWPSASSWLAVLGLGVLCTGLAYALFFRIIDRIGPARALTVTYIVPVFAVTYGALFLGERLTSWMLGAGALVLIGTALSSGFVGLRGRARQPS
ncbi:EamA family transporter [Ramlibacter sp. AW1]|uniref:EamA family transporter n=1 Tax=Ramlibacter aurantiacus TaxID=2801330 RepID=A0A936ZR58_9BURK|nr:EamA family transporter [Ramlibacter aurantiacus]MBL0421016.1 EamA family transporter [Ramlibacter aurantiacus]